MRSKRVQPFVDHSNSRQDQFARGVLQHLQDDDWFHQTITFYDLSGKLARMFGELDLPSERFYPGFLGHIVIEILLDAILIEKFPGKIEEYYDAINEVDPQEIERAVNLMGTNTTDRLAPLIPRFSSERFLEDYLIPEKLLFRLNQVMKRVKLSSLPDHTTEILVEGKQMVEQSWRDLLPIEHFSLTELTAGT